MPRIASTDVRNFWLTCLALFGLLAQSGRYPELEAHPASGTQIE
jgi:hypothetical protein